ncbi:MAG: kelch repeat-containing protein [Ignavibacteriaceae bacterium]|jgi:hypothetical protein|nr:kelch repeat-containing protein [Ignavibacteriaceae bacterium]
MKSKLTLLLLLLNILYSISSAQNSGTWITIDSLIEARVGHSSVLLPNGNVLVGGGVGDTSILSSCEIYDITIGKWRYTTPTNSPLHLQKLLLLKTSKVIAIGGYRKKSCELYDPSTETWTLTDSLKTLKSGGESITTLKDGRILVSGGYRYPTDIHDKYTVFDSCEIYDPVTGKWTTAASMNMPREQHNSVLLEDGTVLVAGGNSPNHTRTCEIYNPTNDTWVFTDSLNEARASSASILLPNGNVFISGGGSNEKSCELYDVTEKKWSYVGDMNYGRKEHQIYYLEKTDQLLIMGGNNRHNGYDDWELYNPNNFKTIEYGIFPMRKIFSRDNTIKLNDGRILITGGMEYESDGMPYLWISKSCQILDYLTTVKTTTIPNSFTLLQNYPNPFNPTTKIKYFLVKSGHIKIIVYDALGRVVQSLINNYQNTGGYELQFNAKELPSGIYFYRLIFDGHSDTKKMLLIK